MAIDLTDKAQRKGATDALKAILASRKETLEIDKGESGPGDGGSTLIMPKNSKQREIEDEIDNGTPTETPEEKKSRLDRIQQDLTQDAIEADLAEIRDDTQMRRTEAERKLKAEKDALAKATAASTPLDFSSFEVDLYRAIKSQVTKAMHKADTWKRPNPTYAGTNLLMPGKDYPDKNGVVTIDVYFDQSGSWGSAEVDKGKQALKILDQFERRKKVKVRLFYFGDHLSTTPNGTGGGTTGFHEVLENIKNSTTQNIIIMTDNDIDDQTTWKYCTPQSVRGCVWWIWGNHRKCIKSTAYVKGARGNYQYWLN